ncbi:MAG: 2-succinyl-5-enolpyruvyl-6-hydroxy-3-cyclohexene-1-carboxylic-acid synthase [Caldilineaceae bacterium]|nr:2-succinyl-5-enolpyruvyl-6-hydroxy-3-cyclohexene-1-carboxylic-acid synthase [Caldilineaceae bacterium]
MNANNHWAAILVEELAACGLDAVWIAPGSRSTPLTLAFAGHPRIRHYLHLDERSAGFAALGMAFAEDRPVALVCTSGTAAAEFFAAVIEARQSHAPLIVLTSDRPPELRHSGANQTIDQVKLYGDQVLWSVDVALPEADPPAVARNNLRTLAARAYATANGIVKGPVHLNLPFRKPLEPETLDELAHTPTASAAVTIAKGVIQPTPDQINHIAALLAAHPQGLIICGPRSPGGDFPLGVAELARKLHYPLLADPISGVRFGPQAETGLVVSAYEGFLNPAAAQSLPRATLTLRFGSVPTSKWLNEYLIRSEPDVQIHVRANGVWADDSHRTTYFLQSDEASLCRALLDACPPPASDAENWLHPWQTADAAARAAAEITFSEEAFDAAYVAALAEELPPGAHLFVGNSLPIRHVDQFALAAAKPLYVYANRGASGIDGVISSALGVAAAVPDQPVVLLIGDISFYHDMNGLLALQMHKVENMTIALLNNNGGGIFRRLPVARLDPLFTELFLTPHGLDFSHAAALYGLKHIRFQAAQNDVTAFRRALSEALAQKKTTLLEVQSDSARDIRMQRTLVSRIGRGQTRADRR